MICLNCPNGCLLTVDSAGFEKNLKNTAEKNATEMITENETYNKKTREYIVSGNECSMGLSFVKQHYEKTLKKKSYNRFTKIHVTSAKTHLPYSDHFLRELLSHWNLKLHRSFPNHFIQGSPERSSYRILITNDLGKRYIIEQLKPETIEQREINASRLFVLKTRGLPVIPYLPTIHGAVTVHYKNTHWMLSPYMKGIPLKRETFWKENWRGKVTADFIKNLYDFSKGFDENKTFYISEYIENALKYIPTNTLTKIKNVVNFLKKELFPIENNLTTSFCHGDPHPFNTIWGESAIKAVIDWEFSGTKPVIYDAALIIGCVGIEHEHALEGGFVKTFIKELKNQSFIHPSEFEILPAYAISLRFAWLTEWLRRNDHGMISFETFYMNTLLQKINQRDFLI